MIEQTNDDEEDVRVLNATPDGSGSFFPGFGSLTLGGNKVFGIQHKADVLALPGDAALDFCLAFAGFVTERTASIDKTLLDALILRADRLSMALQNLRDEGSTHGDPTRQLQ